MRGAVTGWRLIAAGGAKSAANPQTHMNFSKKYKSAAPLRGAR
jgi:hypothetical protein